MTHLGSHDLRSCVHDKVVNQTLVTQGCSGATSEAHIGEHFGIVNDGLAGGFNRGEDGQQADQSPLTNWMLGMIPTSNLDLYFHLGLATCTKTGTV